MRVLQCPLIIADNATVYTKYLKRLGVNSKTVSYFKTWLGYQGDINLELDQLTSEQRQARVRTFVDDFIANHAKKYDIIHFHFFSSLATGFSFAANWHSHPERPFFWDLQAFKDLGLKIVVSTFGSDVRNNSKVTYYQLKFSYPDLVLPYPPLCRKGAYNYIWEFSQYADAVLSGDTETIKHTPFSRLLSIPIDLEPLQSAKNLPFSSKRLSILHAPSHNLLKGTDIIDNVIKKITHKYGDNVELRLISGMSHKEALNLYPGSGVAIDQINHSFGLFALESMYLGRPVITTLRPEEFLPEDPKVHAPVRNVSNENELLSGIINFLEGKDTISSSVMQAYVEENHSGEVIAKQLKEIYESILDGEKPTFHTSPQWMRQYTRLNRNQRVDKNGYYSAVTDKLIELKKWDLLFQEINSGLGLADDIELYAKLFLLSQVAEDTATQQHINDLVSQPQVKRVFKEHLERAKNLADL